jgi:2-polyprenyl-6-methoxyphenol hydroxylase-like FAD-dependent oxidoreductase
MAQYDIIVVGGGPVGLFTAAELAVRGLRVIVYEKRLKRTGHSRGLAFHGRSLDIMASRGLLQQFLDHGVKVPVTHYGGLHTMVFIDKLDVRFVITPLKDTELPQRPNAHS